MWRHQVKGSSYQANDRSRVEGLGCKVLGVRFRGLGFRGILDATCASCEDGTQYRPAMRVMGLILAEV